MNRRDLMDIVHNEHGKTVNEIIYEHLVDEIINLRLEPGARIVENSLAQQLGVSRSPVQIAINQLCAEGFIDKSKGKGARVTEMCHLEYQQIMEIRRAVEGEAIFFATFRISEEELAKMKSLLDGQRIGGVDQPALAYPYIDEGFHRTIITATRNPFFINAYKSYSNKMIRYRNYSIRHYRATLEEKIINYRIHEAIYRTLQHRMPVEARAAALHEIERMRVYMQCLKQPGVQ